eukprot:g34204.t1
MDLLHNFENDSLGKTASYGKTRAYSPFYQLVTATNQFLTAIAFFSRSYSFLCYRDRSLFLLLRPRVVLRAMVSRGPPLRLHCRQHPRDPSPSLPFSSYFPCQRASSSPSSRPSTAGRSPLSWRLDFLFLAALVAFWLANLPSALADASFLSFGAQNCETRTQSQCVRDATRDFCYGAGGLIKGDKYPNPGQVEPHWSCPAAPSTNCCIYIANQCVFGNMSCATPTRINGTNCSQYGLPATCLTRAAGYGCYCDLECRVWGDCCANWVTVCSVPQVLSIFPTQGTSEGGNLLTIYGLNFQAQGTLSNVTIGGAVCNFSVPGGLWSYNADPLAIYNQDGNSKVICRVPPGGGARVVVVTDRNNVTNLAIPDLNNNIDYLRYAPIISTLTPNTPNTTGQTLTLSGSSFGPAPVVSITMPSGFSQVLSTTFANHTYITFNLPAGQGNLNFRVLVTSESGFGSIPFFFASPEITSAVGLNGGINGFITITGTNFGSGVYFDGTIERMTARFGSLAATVQPGYTHFSAVIQIPPGEGSQTVFVNAAGLSSPGMPRAVIFNYDAPVITGLENTLGSTSGGWNVTIRGRNFGGLPLAQSSAMVLFGRGGLACTTSQMRSYNDTYIVCALPEGQGKNLVVYVNVANKESVQTQFTVSYSDPVIDSVSPPVVPTDASVPLLLTGRNFGVEQLVVKQGSTPCTILTHNHTHVLFRPLEGSGTTKSITVTVISAVSNSVTFSYRPPNISSLVLPAGGVPTGGGGIVTLLGSNFGPSSTVASVTFVVRGTSVACVNCISLVDHQRLILQAPAGLGLNNSLTITVGGQSSSTFGLNYRAPTITGVAPATGSARPTGGFVLRLTGADLTGLSDFPPTVTLSHGNCALTSLSNPSDITCQVPAGRGAVAGVLNAGGQTANFAFSFDGPVISSISPVTANTTQASAILTLYGSSFDTDGTVKVGSFNCTILTYNHTTVTCSSPAGEGRQLAVSLTASISGLTATLPALFSYRPPTITSVVPLTGPTLGGGVLTVKGFNLGLNPVVQFGFTPPVQLARIGPTPDHFEYITNAPAGDGQVYVTVKVGGQSSGEFDFLYRYTRPSVTAINPAEGESSGGYNLTVHGANFGTSGRVFFGQTELQVLQRFANQSTIVAIATGGTGSTSVTVQAAGQSSLSAEGTFVWLGPRLDRISPVTAGTGPGTILTLFGVSFFSFGGAQAGFEVTVGGIVCPPVSWNHTVITCQLPANTDKWLQRDVVVQVAYQLSTLRSEAVKFTYTLPEVTAIFPQQLSTTGGPRVTVQGTNFGGSAQALTVKVGTGTCGSQVTNTARNEIYCNLPAGQDTRLVRVVGSEIGVQSSNSLSYTYGAPNVTSITPSTLDTPGGLVTISGANFFTSGVAYIGSQVCSQAGTGWNDTAVTCRAPAGVGARLDVRVVTGTRSSTLAASFNYSAPRLTALSPTNGPTSGGIDLTLTGASLGLTGAVVTVDGKDCPLVSQNHDRIKCKLPAGNNINRVVNLTVAGLPSATQLSFSYDGPSITSTTSNVRTQGNETVTINGFSFGLAGVVNIAGRPCLPVLSWDHSQITCNAPEGEGVNNAVVVTTSPLNLNSLPYYGFDYRSPSVSSVATVSGSYKTAGNEVLVIQGDNFGLNPMVKLTLSRGSGVITESCTILTRGHTQITCALPAGQGEVSVDVVVSGRSADPTGSFKYNAPTLSNLDPKQGPAGGGTNVTLTGLNFGFTPAVLLDGYECLVTYIAPTHDRMYCTTSPGTGQTSVKVVVAFLESAVTSGLTFRYDGPQITQVFPASGPTQGGVVLTIRGLGLQTGDVTVGGTACPVTGQRNATQVLCVLPPGEGAKSITITSTTSSNGFLFNYDSPDIGSVSPSAGPTEGNEKIWIRGRNFGEGTSVRVSIGGKSCVSDFANHTFITCLTPKLSVEQAVQPLVVTVGSQAASVSFTLLAPTITLLDPASGPTTGGQILTLSGSSFSTTGTIYVGESICSKGAFPHTHTSLKCTLPEGSGAQNVTLRTFQGTAISKPVLFTYDLPKVNTGGVSPSSGPTEGGVLITLAGTNFGPAPGRVLVGGATCATSPDQWDHTRIVCELPPGAGQSVGVVVQAGGQACEQCGTFSYEAPQLDRLTPANGPTSGQNIITLVGRNLGGRVSDLTIEVKSATETRACQPLSAAHVNATCRMPAFSGTPRQVRVTVAGSVGATKSYAYDAPIISLITGCPEQDPDTPNQTIDCSVQGGNLITLNGLNFGEATPPQGNVMVGSLPCTNLVMVAPHTRLTCNVPANPVGGFDLPVSVTVDGQVGSAPLLSYAGPVILPGTLVRVLDPSVLGAITISNPFATEYVEFAGKNLGSNNSAITIKYGLPSDPFGYFDCASPTLVNTNPQRVRCRLVSGVGKGLVFQVKVGQQTSQPGVDTLSYDAPEIRPNTIRTHPNGSTGFSFLQGTSSQGQNVAFDVDKLGGFPSYLKVVYGLKASNGPFDQTCDLLAAEVTTSRIVCRTRSSGVVGPFVFKVQTLNSLSNAGTDEYAYPQSPQIYVVSGCSDRDNATFSCPTEGGMVITIQGAYFADTATSVTVDSVACAIQTVTTSRITCVLSAGKGPNRAVVVSVGESISRDVYKLSYAPPTLAAIQGCSAAASPSTSAQDCPRTGGEILTITGSNFGSSEAVVLVGGQLCTELSHVAGLEHTKLTCRLPRGSGLNKTVMVIQRQASNNSLSLSYQQCPAGEYSVSGDACAPCANGSYTSVPGRPVCTQCEPGRYAPSPALTSCTVCEQGKAVNRGPPPLSLGAHRCDPCAPGYYSPVTGLISCLPCAAGTYQNRTGQKECLACPKGSYSGQNAQTCVPCQPGEYADSPSSITCRPCEAGKFSSGYASYSCTDCEAGSAQALPSQTSCPLCDPGYANKFEGQVACRPCENGRFANASGMEECLACPAGETAQKRSPTEGAIECTPCSPGYSMNLPGQPVCLMCAQGRAIATYRATTCPACNLGFSAASLGKQRCDACQPGYFASTIAAVSCELCPEGRYQNQSEAEQCKPCELGRVTGASKGATTCQACDAGSIAGEIALLSCSSCLPGTSANLPGLSECAICAAGFFSTGASALGPTLCKPCDMGTAGLAARTGGSCPLCPAGRFQNATGQQTCKPCSAGYANSALGQTACLECEAGYASSLPEQKTCAPCSSGFFSDRKRTLSCTACPAGFFQDEARQQSCKACLPGFFAENSFSDTCAPCPAGRFTNVYNSSDCTICGEGYVQPAEKATSCVPCGHGTYMDRPGELSCLACIPGRFSNDTANKVCRNCPKGRFAAGSNTENCNMCAVGYYAPNEGLIQCKPALAGQFVPLQGAELFDLCSAGFFQDGEGESSCKPCPPRQYSGQRGSITCLACPAGRANTRYNASSCSLCLAGQTSQEGDLTCSDCTPGYFSRTDGALSCSACDIGTYQNLTGKSACQDCPPGTSQPDQGKLSCLECEPGRANPGSGEGVCGECSPGFFAASSGATACRRCAIGYFSGQSKAEVCDPCGVGKFQDAVGKDGCKPCPRGSYTNQTRQSSCQLCQPGFAAQEGRAYCTECTLGYFAASKGQGVCLPCKKGKFGVSSTECNLCSPGFAQAVEGQTSCSPCVAGKYSGAAGLDVCLQCPQGFVSADNATECAPCAAGYYQDLPGKATCLPCSAGTAKSNVGAGPCDQCPLGQISAAGQSRCNKCAAGFVPDGLAGACLPCSKGKYGALAGAFTCLDCEAGYFSNQTNSTICTPCGLGTYQSLKGQQSCTSCPTKQYTDEAGSINCKRCPVGKFENRTGQSECQLCPVGRFFDGASTAGAGTDSCDSCSPGFFTTTPGQSVCEPCPAGRFQSGYGSSVCDMCEKGKSEDDIGQPACVWCDVGRFANTEGNTLCEECPAGFFANRTGLLECATCERGYASGGGESSCAQCLPGYYQAVRGQSSCLTCELGTKQAGYGAVDCTACDPGYYQDEIGKQGCKPCQPGSYSYINTGFKICSPCAAGYYQAGINATTCNACQTGRFQNRPGEQDCKDCPAGRAGAIVGLSVCAPCLAGSFQNLTKQTTCQLCPLGRSQNETDRSSCSECFPGFYSSINGRKGCVPCQPGTVMPGFGASACRSCLLGFFQKEEGRQTCGACPPGRFAQGTGEIDCELCAPGFYSSNFSAFECIPCEAGTSAEEEGSERCSDCPPGTTTSGSGQSICDPCQVGRASNISRAPTCDLCDPGFYADLPGFRACKPCEKGEYGTSQGAQRCTKCKLGEFQDEKGKLSCKICQAPNYSDDLGAEVCVPCKPGYFTTTTGTIQCTACEAGKHVNASGAFQCDLCPQGRQAPNQGTVVCALCPKGSYSVRQGLVECDPCPAGTYNNHTGLSTLCPACPAGYVQSKAGEALCEECALGKFNRGNGLATCDLCPAGYFGNKTGLGECYKCKKGRYQEKSGQESCKPCEPGRSAEQEGSASCSPCRPGYATNLTGQLTCQECEMGYAQEQQEQIECTPCPRGSYANQTGTKNCVPCAEGTFTATPGLFLCDPCPPGQEQPKTGMSTCNECPPGSVTGRYGTSTCSLCDEGSYSDHNECKLCPVGKYADFKGAGSCKSCEQGFFANSTGNLACLPCPAGLAQSEFGKENCSFCAANTFSSGQASPFCRPCIPGYFALLTATGPRLDCQPCFPGFQKSDLLPGPCIPCRPGKHAPSIGTDFCPSCPIGTYTDKSGQLNCTVCAPGLFAAETGREFCLPCVPGRTSPSSGAAFCRSCEPGFVARAFQQQVCEGCTPGRYSNLDRTDCVPCDAGFFATGSNSYQCEACPRGFVQNTTGGIECPPCPPGSQAPVPGSVSCSVCSVGKFGRGGGALCTDCSERTVAPYSGASSCVKCPGKLSTASQDRRECLCERGFFLDPSRCQLAEDDMACEPCLPCPRGGKCEQEGTTLANMQTFSGFYRPHNSSMIIYTCVDQRDCPGGAAGVCKVNSGGPLCAVCDDHYYRTSVGLCTECPPQGASLALFLLISIVVILAVIGQFWFVNQQGLRKMKAARRMDEAIAGGEADDFDLFDDDDKPVSKIPHTPAPPPPSWLYKFKISLGFFQIMSNLSFSVDIPWPATYRSFINAFAILNFDLVSISSVECVFPQSTYYTKFIFFGMGPLLVAFCIWLGYLVPKYIMIWRGEDIEQNPWHTKTARRKFWRMLMFALFLIYPVVSSTVVRLFVCQEVEGVHYLVADYRLECYTDTWWNYAFAGIVLIVIYPIGIPSFITLKVYQYRNRLNNPGVIAMFGMMYHGYFHDSWWFEVLDMLHKLALTSLIAFLPTQAQLIGGVLVVMAYLDCILLIKPYPRQGDDRLHIFAQNTLMLLFLSAYVFRLDRMWDPTVDLLLSIVFIILTCLFVGFLFSQFFAIALRKVVMRRRDFAESLSEYLPFVRTWIKEAEEGQTTMTAEQVNEMRLVKRRDEHADTMMKRNPLYVDNTTTGLHTRMGEMHLMSNPMANANIGKSLAEMDLGTDFLEAENMLKQRGRDALGVEGKTSGEVSVSREHSRQSSASISSVHSAAGVITSPTTATGRQDEDVEVGEGTLVKSVSEMHRDFKPHRASAGTGMGVISEQDLEDDFEYEDEL